MATSNTGARAADIQRYWRVLCEQIGNRYSGTKNEQRAADYIESQFKRFGLANVSQQFFEFPNWQYTKGILRVGRGRQLKRVATAMPWGYSISTPKRPVRGKLVYLQSGSEMDFKQDLQGKVGLVIGPLSFSDPALKTRIIRSKLAALVIVDSRVPYAWTTPTGAAPHWVGGYRVPTIGVSYFDAHNLIRQLPLTAEITIKAHTFKAKSQNVIGEVVGSRRPDQVILVSGHHDCVMGNVGANDNGSGVVFTLELARLFAKARPKRTIRFLSYGVEEKLSIGSYLYMRSLSPKQRKGCVLAINADGIGGHVGTDEIHVTGTRRLSKLVSDCWQRAKHPATVHHGLMPYSDHFPFNICGVPSVVMFRPSMMDGGLWELHSANDNLDNVSPSVMVRTINSTARLMRQIVSSQRLPFDPVIEPELMREVRRAGKQLYHHPWSPDQFEYPDH